MSLKKLAASALLAASLVVATPAVADARPAAGGGVQVGHKELCKKNTSWFERYVLLQPDFKWVPCRTLGR